MVDTTLGPCHYSDDMSEQATMMAVREDGTGWIPICEEHKSDAESDGYTPQEVKDVPDAIEQNEDLPVPGSDEAADDGDDPDSDADTDSDTQSEDSTEGD